MIDWRITRERCRKQTLASPAVQTHGPAPYTFPFCKTNEFGYSHDGWLTKLDENPQEVELELVWGKHKNKPYIVQIRAASEHVELNPPPTPEAKAGFVPQPCAFTIDDIYVVEDLNDLGALEAVDEAPKGLLVIQPFGSLLSHASAHCRALGIPLVIDDPENYQVGDQISGIGSWVVKGDAPTALVTGADYDPADYTEAFWKGTDYAREFWDRKWDRLALFFHQFASTPSSDPEDTAFLAGAFTGFLTMASAMVCLGEARHIRGNTSSNYSAAGYRTKLNEVFTVFARLMPDRVDETNMTSMSMGRDKVYEWFEDRTFTWGETASLLDFLTSDVFGHEEVGWCSAYGGKAWAKSAGQALKVAEAIDARDISAAISSINKLENAVHNGGWLFNKFASKIYFDKATSGLSYGEDEHLAFRMAEAAEELHEGIYAMRHADRYVDTDVIGVLENARQEPIEALTIYESDNDEEPSTEQSASPGGAHGKATLTGSDAPSEGESEGVQDDPDPSPKELDPAGYKEYTKLVEWAYDTDLISGEQHVSLFDQSPGVIRDGDVGGLVSLACKEGRLQYLRRFAEPENENVKGKLNAHAYDNGWDWESGVPHDLLEDADFGGLVKVYDPDSWYAVDEHLPHVHPKAILKTLVKWLDDAGFISPKEGDQLLSGKYYSKSRVIEALLRAVEKIDPEDEWSIFHYVKLHPAKQQGLVNSFGYTF